MSYISKASLYTDQDPVDKRWNGQVLEAGNEAAKFLVVGAGCVLSDEEVSKFGLANHKCLTPYDPAEAAATREAAIVQRSAELAASRDGRVGGPASLGQDQQPTKPKPAKAQRVKKPSK